MTKISIIDAVDDPQLFKLWFKNSETWQAWRSFHKALFGLQMTAEEFKTFQTCTGRDKAPSEQVKEAWLIIGRRGGKSFNAALIAVYLSCFFDYRQYLAPGEHGTVALIAQNKKQARVLMRYVSGLLNNVALLKPMIQMEGKETIELTNHVDIEIHTASFRGIRGYTILAAIADEIAFWRSDESANPDVEVLNALRPAMLTIPNAMLICLGSPYARRGAMYEAHKENYGKDTDILVWQAPTRTMNPAVDQKVIDRAYKKDPASASAEYGGEFRSDVENFISKDVIDSCVVPGRHEIPYIRGIQYHAFVDPSGGSSDSMTLAVAHKENETIVIDCLRERKPPFSPESVVLEFCDVLDSYFIKSVIGDRYAGMWPRERFKNQGISYLVSERPVSQIYLEFLPMLNSGQVELLDHKKMLIQLQSLERKTGKGRDSIDHPPGGHDDLVNVVAGVSVLQVLSKKKRFGTWGRGVSNISPERKKKRAIRQYIAEHGRRPNIAWLDKNGFLPESKAVQEAQAVQK